MSEGISRKGYYALGGIVGLYIVVLVFFLMIPSPSYYNFLIRFFALTGFYTLAIAALLTPFMKQIYQEFGRAFQDIHHIFAAVGLASATLHPVIFAIQVSDLSVFLPDLSSWYAFWLFGGRQALILIYVATLAALMRRKIPKYWKSIHLLMYLVLLFVLVHGFLIGTDFRNFGIQIIFTSLFVAALGALIYNRIQ